MSAYDATDDVSGVQSAQIILTCVETGHSKKFSMCAFYYDKELDQNVAYEDGMLHGTFQISEYMPAGKYVVESILLNDNAQNRVTYSRTDDPQMPDQVKNAVLNVLETGKSDNTPPVLNGVTLSATSVTAPGQIQVTMDAFDDLSGIASASIHLYCKETEKFISANIVSGWYDYEDGLLHGTLEIDQYVETGNFVISTIWLSDKEGNSCCYSQGNNGSPSQIPDDALASVLPESVCALTIHVFNTTPDVTTSVSKSDFVDVVVKATNNAYIAADYSGDATMPKAAFEAIAGTGKTIDLISEGITWRFEGNDITEEIKDINLKVEIQKVEEDPSASGDAIEGSLNGNPGVVMKFPENGTLPGKATIQVKVDYAMREYLGSDTGLSVYYYNNQTGELELIASNLKVINDTYVEFPITHCSYYVLAPTLNNGSTNDNTGTCGDNLTWEFDKKTGVLTVKGTGPMYEYADGYVDGKTTPPWADGDRDRIKRVVIEEGVTTISDAAFCGFEKIQSVSIPSTVESIGGIAFEYCYSLESVVLPDNITSIGVSAFLDCRQLSSVVIGSEIETIGGFAFGGCSSLKSITFNGDAPSFGSNPNDVFCDVTATAYYPANNPTWTSNVMQNYGGTITWVPYGNSGTCGANLTWNYNEATKVLTISGTGPMQDFTLDGTWYGAKATDTPWHDIQHKILEVVIESGVTTVGRGAFAGMEQLIVVSLPDTLTSVGDFAFHGDTSLKALNIPDGVTYLGQYSLCCCPNLVTISLPDGITEITTSLLDQTWPNNVTIPTGVTTVGSKAFAYGTISEIVFTGNAPTFAADTFYNQTTTVRYPKNNATWTDAVKQNYGGAITWLEAESSVDDTDIGEPVFTTASGTWGSNISWNLDATGLLTISGSGVMDHFSENPNMDYSAGLLYPWHSYANGITRLVVNENIEGLNANAFAGLKYLTRVTLPDSLKDMGFGAFADCISLTDVTFGSGITEIGDSAFARCTALERITIPSNVTRIGQQSFDGCKKLKDISIPEGVTVIWKQAFRKCTSLTSIVFPESLASIGVSAFESCTGLTKVTLPAKLLALYKHAFYNCTNLKKLYFEGNYPDILPYALLNLKATAYYPEGNSTWTSDRLSNYGGDIIWKAYRVSGNQDVLPVRGTWDNLTWEIDKNGTLTLFGTGGMIHYQDPNAPWDLTNPPIDGYPWHRYSDKITAIAVEEGVTSLAEIAFHGLKNLKGVTLPGSLITIDGAAFSFCTSLESITLPANVSTIGKDIFVGSTAFEEITFAGNAPTFDPETFTGVTATAYYPAGNATWTEDVMQDYGGDITWKINCPGHVFGQWITEGNTSRRTCTLCGYTEHKVVTDSGDVEIEIPGQPDLDVDVNPVLPSEKEYILVEQTLESTQYDVLKVFDINLKNSEGVHVQPDGTVKVKLPLDWEKDGNYKVYRVNPDKTLTDMHAFRQGSHMVFETDHFSIYVIAEERVVTAPTAKTLTYTGSAQALVNAGSVTGGTLQYSLDGVTYAADIPTATNAGTYTIYYKVEGSQEEAQTVSATIAKAMVTITADDKTAAVGAAKPTLTYTVTGLKGTDKLTSNPTLTCNATMSTTGEYEITVSGGDAGANYEIQRVNGKLSVKKEHKITVASATNGTVSISPEKAIEGTQVTITVTPKIGYKLSTLVVKDAAGNSYTVSTDNNGKYYFIMPAVEVTVTATFTKTSTSIADTSNPKTGDDFNMVLWSGMAMTSLLCMAAMVLGKKKHG